MRIERLNKKKEVIFEEHSKDCDSKTKNNK